MKSVRFVMVGGFLGAGKTTLLGRLAQHYQQRGLKVGIITNDQASNLVDTHQFRTQGLAAEEIPGGCFCCRFDALAEAAGKLTVQERPDVLLAEPVGSCTDLVATVVQPLKRLYSGQYRVAPYSVLLDPVRTQKILAGERLGGFSPKVAYIFHKQLEEADVVVVNKVDLLDESGRTRFLELLEKHYPGKETLMLSARTGEGLEHLFQTIEREGAFGRSIPEVDYDTYAEGEAELGWLNATARVTSAQPLSADTLLARLAEAIQAALRKTEGEIAHLKMLVHADGKTGIINLVRGDGQAEFSRKSAATSAAADLVINARVRTDPEVLWSLVERCLIDLGRAMNAQIDIGTAQRFRPGRPVPTHRYAEAV